VSEPFSAFNFLVEIRVPGTASPLCGAAFAECSGLEIALDVRTLHEGGDNAAQRLLAGPVSYGRVTLRRGMTPDFDLWDWCAAVLADRTLRADARVVVLAPDGSTERARFRLRGCLPARLRAPALNALEGGVAIEELELACESLVLERPGSRARPAPRARAKAQLVDLEGGSEVAVQLNPEALRLLHGEPARRLTAELWFESTRDVRALTEPIVELVGAPAVRFQWGSVRFDGRLETVEETLDLFAPDGRPLRSRLDLTLVAGPA
jgi:phage tail-like protein